MTATMLAAALVIKTLVAQDAPTEPSFEEPTETVEAAEEAPVVEAPLPAPALLVGNWRRLATCESSLVPTAVSRNGLYFGLFQFDLPTWRSVGEVGNPIYAPPAVQLAAAQRLQARRGWAPWPYCSRVLGLR